MFTMTIHDARWKVLAHGESLRGETWEQTFLRLYQAKLPEGSRERRFAVNDKPGRRIGMAIKTAVTAHTDRDGRVETDPPVIIHTRPAQF